MKKLLEKRKTVEAGIVHGPCSVLPCELSKQ